MTADSTEHNPVEELAAEFLERYRKGECPSITEYAQRHPDLSDEIRDLFPTIAAMEQLKLERIQTPSSCPGMQDLRRLERLGDFRLIREIGRGGMGVVFEAEQESLGRRVAVKVLPGQALPDAKRLGRFEREARTAAGLHHTNIVPVFGVGEQDGLHYYVMQFIRGVGLDAVIQSLSQAGTGAPTNGTGAQLEVPASFNAEQAALALRSGTFPKLPREMASRQSNGSSTGSVDKVLVPKSDSTTGEKNLEADVQLPATFTREQKAKTNQQQTAVPSPGAPVPKSYWKSIARLVQQVANALDYAHSQNVLHRDIKPANLLLDATGTLWVADFGLAKVLEQDKVSQTGDVVGTLQYMAPEQFQGKFDSRTDICSLGLTMYELLTLQPAFQDSDRARLIRKITQEEPPGPRKLNPAIPRDLETIVLKAINRDPARRYQTAKELENDLQRFLEDRPIQARRASPLERLGRWCRRNPAVAGLTALTLSLLVLVAVVATIGYVRVSAALEGETQQLQIAENALKSEAQQHQIAVNAQKEEVEQRKKAENTSSLALEVLDQIFEKLAPDRITAASELTFTSGSGEQVEVALQPTLSAETAALLQELLGFYDKLAQQGSRDSKLRIKAARANRRVGDIRYRLGQGQEALEAYGRSVAIFEELAQQSPADIALKAELAGVHNAIGLALIRNFQIEKAKDALASAVKVLTLGAGAKNSDPRITFALARTYFHYSKLPPKGPPPGAKRPNGTGPPPKVFGGPPPNPSDPKKPVGPPPWNFGKWEGELYLDKAVQLLDGLLKEHPAVPAYQQLLALWYREKAMRPSWPPTKNEGKDRKAAIDLLKQLVKDYPNVPDYRLDLCETLARMGGPPTFFFLADKNAETDLKEALRLAQDLVSEHPNVADYQVSRAHIHWKLALVHQRNKHLDKAEEELRQALKLHNALVKRFPDVVFHKLSRAKIQESLAGIYMEEKKWKESRTVLESSIDQLQQLRNKEEKLFFLNFTLADHYEKLAQTLKNLGEPEQAAQATAQAKKLRPFPGPPK